MRRLSEDLFQPGEVYALSKYLITLHFFFSLVGKLSNTDGIVNVWVILHFFKLLYPSIIYLLSFFVLLTALYISFIKCLHKLFECVELLSGRYTTILGRFNYCLTS